MAGARLTLDFFHDVVCGWCFNISPRLHALSAEFALDIRHRSYVLQDSRERMIEVFGSMARAKRTILGHWAACQAASDTPERFNIDAMRGAHFDYPHGLPGALACKAAERIDGQKAHWQMFDAIQQAHIVEARNITDRDELLRIAQAAGFDPQKFAQLLACPQTRSAVEDDRRLAARLQVASVPAIIIRETGARLINGPIKDLRAQISANLHLSGQGRAHQ